MTQSLKGRIGFSQSRGERSGLGTTGLRSEGEGRRMGDAYAVNGRLSGPAKGRRDLCERALESRGRVTHKARLPATRDPDRHCHSASQRGAYACTSGAPPRAPPPARRGRAPPRLEPRACTRPRGMMSGQSGSRRSAWPLLPWLDDDHRTRLVCLGVTRPGPRHVYAENPLPVRWYSRRY